MQAAVRSDKEAVVFRQVQDLLRASLNSHAMIERARLAALTGDLDEFLARARLRIRLIRQIDEEIMLGTGLLPEDLQGPDPAVPRSSGKAAGQVGSARSSGRIT